MLSLTYIYVTKKTPSHPVPSHPIPQNEIGWSKMNVHSLNSSVTSAIHMYHHVPKHTLPGWDSWTCHHEALQVLRPIQRCHPPNSNLLLSPMARKTGQYTSQFITGWWFQPPENDLSLVESCGSWSWKKKLKPPNEYLVQPLSSAGLRLPIAHEPPAPQSPSVGPWPAQGPFDHQLERDLNWHVFLA